jgi:hypothetical protein
MKRPVPAGRRAAFDILAEAAKTERICVVVCDRIIRRQYQRAFVKRGVDLSNVFFITRADADREAAP